MKMEREKNLCQCKRPSSNWYCGSCLRQLVVDHLQAVGYDAALCMSKWKPMGDIPGGKFLCSFHFQFHYMEYYFFNFSLSFLELHEFCFSTLMYHRLNFQKNYTPLELFLLLSFIFLLHINLSSYLKFFLASSSNSFLCSLGFDVSHQLSQQHGNRFFS